MGVVFSSMVILEMLVTCYRIYYISLRLGGFIHAIPNTLEHSYHSQLHFRKKFL